MTTLHAPVAWSRNPGSFRDHSGFVFSLDGVAYRQVNAHYAPEYTRLVDSGLYEELSTAGLLVAHEEVSLRLPDASPAFAVLKPEQIPFISYPYEWCFSQLQAAAALTLDVQKRALLRGMTLRDATPFNVQFRGTRPVFIDTLSFGPYEEGRPWSAYNQFCTLFLAPLALMASSDASLVRLIGVHVNGLPLDMVSRLLPRRTWFKPGLLTHLHLHGRAHAGAQRRAASAPTNGNPSAPASRAMMSKRALLGLIDSLSRTVSSLTFNSDQTTWSDYVSTCNYTARASEHKRELVKSWVQEAHGPQPALVWDLGANTGDFSFLIESASTTVVSFDGDHAAVEKMYRRASQAGSQRVLPLVQDLANPSGGLGWRNRERLSLEDRGPADVVLALALLHHLLVTAQVPMSDIAAFFAKVSRHLIVEFVPRSDPQVERMLALRESGSVEYSQADFEAAFGQHFTVVRSAQIADSPRHLYWLKRIAVS